jgi:hypothetical protein
MTEIREGSNPSIPWSDTIVYTLKENTETAILMGG